MEVTNAAGVELTAKLGRDGGSDQLPRRGQIIEALEQVVEPLRDGRSAALGETARGCDIGNGQNSRNDLGLDARGCRFVAEAKEAVGREEKLGDRPADPSKPL